MDRYRIIHICHLQQVLGASILLHLDGLSAPLLCSGILRIFSIRWHLEIPTLENQFTYVIFILPVYKRMRESENLQLILLSCIHFWCDLRRDHYLMLRILTGNTDHLRRTIVQPSALKPSQIWNQVMQLRWHNLVGFEIYKLTWQTPWATCSTALLLPWWKNISLHSVWIPPVPATSVVF